MTRRDDSVALRHMLDHATEAVEMAGGRSRADLDSDRQLNLSLTRLVEVVGEAARRVSAGRRGAHPEVPWREIVGTRDRLVHGYDEVDFDVLWKIVRDELPVLVERLKVMLDEAEGTETRGDTE